MKNLVLIVPVIMLFSSTPLLQSCNEHARARDSAKNVIPASAVSETPFLLTDEFKNYWYAGKAELSSYKLKQAR